MLEEAGHRLSPVRGPWHDGARGLPLQLQVPAVLASLVDQASLFGWTVPVQFVFQLLVILVNAFEPK